MVSMIIKFKSFLKKTVPIIIKAFLKLMAHGLLSNWWMT